MDCIILCGGSAKRMKPYLPFSKALAEIRPNMTLLEHQIEWLTNSGIDRIILAIDRETYQTLGRIRVFLSERVRFSIEDEKLGTGGAVFKAIKQVKDDIFYVMNVDDILISETYTPQDLLETLQENKDALGSILLAKTRFPFGIVDTSNKRVRGFRQKPKLDYKICSGHYAFAKEGVRKYFPRKGDFENKVLPRMAQHNCLYCEELNGEWITVNNIKQLEAAKERLMKLVKTEMVTLTSNMIIT
jgi:NDP-sugar pyrophosphorylase family protein